MRQTLRPAMFLGSAILLCTIWLSVRPPLIAVQTPTRGAPPPSLVEPASITLDTAILERYVGRYAGRSGLSSGLTLDPDLTGLTLAVVLRDGRLFVQTPAGARGWWWELRAITETKFVFVKGRDAPTSPSILRYNGATWFGPYLLYSANLQVEFDVADDGTVRGLAATTDYGIIEAKRVH